MGHNAIRRSDDRVAEGAPLLREYVGKNLHRGFESLSLRQEHRTRRKAGFCLGLAPPVTTEPRLPGGFCFGRTKTRTAEWRLPIAFPGCYVPVFESVVPQHRVQLTHIKYAAETLVGYLHFLIWRLR